jgi:hypothetical protein
VIDPDCPVNARGAIGATAATSISRSRALNDAEFWAAVVRLFDRAARPDDVRVPERACQTGVGRHSLSSVRAGAEVKSWRRTADGKN